MTSRHRGYKSNRMLGLKGKENGGAWWNHQLMIHYSECSDFHDPVAIENILIYPLLFELR